MKEVVAEHVAQSAQEKSKGKKVGSEREDDDFGTDDETTVHGRARGVTLEYVAVTGHGDW